MRSGTAGQLAVRQILPPDIAADVGVLDKKGIEAALDAVATRYPERYREIAKNLMDLGRVTAYRSGGFSFGLQDLAPGRSTLAARARIKERIAVALDEPDRAKRRAMIDAAVDMERDQLTKDLYAESVGDNNPFGMQVLSGSRGNPTNLRSLRGFDGAYEDHHGNRIPLPILANYAEGLPAASYFAGTFGARKGVLDVKACLSGDTLVLMADFTARRIDEIAPGMFVFGSDHTGRLRSVQVVRRYDNGPKACVRVTFGTAVLTATLDHKILTLNYALRPLRDIIERGDAAYLTSSGRTGKPSDVTPCGEILTYDLEVDHPDHMFVLDNGLVVSNSTADAGYAAKQLIQGNHRLVVTALDDDDDDPDNANVRGLPVQTDDQDNVGALLAMPAGGYPRNTQLTPKILAELRRAGVDDILVRSPAVGGPADGGVYARDVGVRERGGLAPQGDFIGHAAGQAVSEKLTQMQLSSKHCLAAGTQVRMADWSVKAIENICVGDLVLGSDMTGQTRPVRVLETFDNGYRECSSFTFRAPFSKRASATVIATAEHKILAMRKYTGQKLDVDNYTPKQLPLGTSAPRGRFSAVRTIGFTPDAQFTREPLARLLGVWLGDGIRVLPTTGVMVSCFDDALANAIEENIAPLGLHFHKMAGHPGQYFVGQLADKTERDADSGQFLPGYRNPLKKLLATWGLLGKYAHEKTIPAVAFSWDNESIAELLSGLWVTDGSVFIGDRTRDKPYLSYGSTSLPLIEQIRDLLAWRFGIHVSGPYSTTSGRKRTLHSIAITTELGVARFRALLQLHGKKRVLFDQLLDIWRVERPRGGAYGLIRDTVTSVGLLPTYDIHVDHPDHLFVLASGLIVSNSGGVAGAGPVGFPLINQMMQVPEAFRGGAVHAQADGVITGFRAAPQGGHYFDVGGQEHYVSPDQTLRFKPGDTVEAGDTLTDGIPNPAEIVRHKGIGEGRRYFANALRTAMQQAGTHVSRRNMEVLSRGLINHVRMTDLVDDYAPDDVVPYHTIERNWQPRAGAVTVAPSQAVGSYLERPTLHYTIGTRVTKNMVPQLSKFGVTNVTAHREPPPFVPEMQRAAAAVSTDPDWQVRMLGSGQKGSLLDATHRGASSDEAGTSFVPAMIRSENFGVIGPTKGW